jgi:uncharacterized protein
LPDLAEPSAALAAFFARNPRAALGFSGGADSSYLLYAARQSGADVRPYFVKSPFQPAFELRDARRLAEELRCELTVIAADTLSEPRIAANGPDRCYHCKKLIFSAIAARAAADGYTLLLDGTNASDNAADRAGMRATAELNVRSPLREAGLSKAEVRELSRRAGLFTWDKPAYACLATRIQTGVPVTAELLRKIETAEDFLFSLGYTDFRVRTDGRTAKLQVPETQLPRAFADRQTIAGELRAQFADVVLDLMGR